MAAEFEYLLNAMERAALESNPAKHNYYDKRTAVLGHVSAIEAERDQLLATPADKREDLRCVIADISAQCAALWAERDQLRAENEALREALISIEEYWNRDQNEKAMADACWHAVETAHAALAAKGEGK